MSAALGLIGPVASIAGSLFGLGSQSGNASNVPQAPPVYQPQSQPAADTAFTGGVGTLQSSTVPSAINTQNFLYNNPGTAAAEAGANVAGGLGQVVGMQDFAQGNNLTTQGNNLFTTGNSVVPYAYSALTAGFDPMGNVYNQQFQQNTDQTRALLEARGIDNTPYGAGVESQSDLNFNNAWLYNQLGRQTQGAQTAATLFGQQASDYGQGGNLVTGGMNLSGQAPGTYFQGASMPYNTYQTVGTNQFGALQGSQGLQQTPLQDYLQYLQLGQGASQIGTQQEQTNLNRNALAWNQNMQLGNALGQGISGLSKGISNLPAGTFNFGTG